MTPAFEATMEEKWRRLLYIDKLDLKFEDPEIRPPHHYEIY